LNLRETALRPERSALWGLKFFWREVLDFVTESNGLIRSGSRLEKD
jgi:hypothetical protein